MSHSTNISQLHARAHQGDETARAALTTWLQAELGPRIARLLQDRPYRDYLGADGLFEAARQRLLDRERPPDNFSLWLSGVAQEHLLAVLLQPARLDDPDAVAVFYRQLRPMLEPIIRRWLHRSPIRQVVETIDLVHTAYHRLTRHVRQKGGPPSHLGPWLNKVVRNRVFELFRRHARNLMLSAFQAGDLKAPGRAPGDELADREEVQRWLRYMGPITRELHRLHFLEGLGWREAGAAVNLSAGAARQRWYKWLAAARQEARQGSAEPLTGKVCAEGRP
jgi:RNA polymerase sigma factor (sigma-70 family)